MTHATQSISGPLDQRLDEIDFAVLDLETTGLSPSTDRILQIGIVRLTSGRRMTPEWETRVYPGRGIKVPQEILEMTGLEERELLAAPRIERALTEVAHRIEGRTLAGHNVWRFDLQFLRCAAEEVGVDLPIVPCVDTLPIARRLHPDYANHRLTTCLGAYGIELAPAHHHDALHDAYATAALLSQQVELLRCRGVETLGHLVEFLARDSTHCGVRPRRIASGTAVQCVHGPDDPRRAGL